MESVLDKQRVRSLGPSLSPIEFAVLRGIASGRQSKELAQDLQRAKPTVECHVRSLLAKFGARSRAHLVAIALCRGILEYEHVDLPFAG